MVQKVCLELIVVLVMRCRAAKITVLLLGLLMVSCKVEMPKDVLSPEKMEAVLYDYHLVQSMSATLASVDYKEKLMYSFVYDKHGISKEEFDSALVWYNRYPKYMKEIYGNLEAKLQADVDMLGGAKVVQDECVDLDAVNLALNVAELWTGHPVKMLSPTPLNNKILFSFDVPTDSSFVAGDSLVFSFNAMFVSRNDSIRQEAYAAINLDYDDDSYYAAGVSVKESGFFMLPVARSFSTRLKSMSGYVYYFDNDTAYSSRMVLSDLSLKRLHPAKKTNKKVRK